MTDEPDDNTAPPADKALLAVAAVLLALPLVAILWVPFYARKDPELGGVPFFFWYQFAWVFLCAAATWAAYRLVLKARPHRPMRGSADDGDAR
ncbi:DUF3311 domain-containing protein [Rhodococcus tukisamuensis]|uniref:DUF3311 domain-containing protein n=1 Tax=Rhodococcus tukisamuensis TaxID=168276 RepID=UPI000933EB67|nr:DUF3311 domain-containing protein [Rhodococcus tukisamuensis]